MVRWLVPSLFVLTVVLVHAPGAAAQQDFMINSSAVNLRDEPSIDSQIQFRLPFGTKCSRLQTKGAWTRIRIPTSEDGYEGWVYSRYVSKVRFVPVATDNRWIDLAQHPEKGLKAPIKLEDIPCKDSLDRKCVEDYRNRYYIERRNALERWIYWEHDVPFKIRQELWAILGGPYTPYVVTPPEIINASAFAQLPARAESTQASGAKSYRVDIHGERSKGLECSRMPEVDPSFFQELPERFGIARGQAHGAIVDFSGASGSDELMKVMDVYFPDQTPFAFETSDRYVSEETIPVVLYDLTTKKLERNSARPVFIPSRNMFLLTELDEQNPHKRKVLVFYSWIEVYLDQLMQAEKIRTIRVDPPVKKGECASARLALDGIDMNGDHVADVILVDGEKQGSCGYRRKDTYINVDGAWRGYVNNYEAWCDDTVDTPKPTPTPLPF